MSQKLIGYCSTFDCDMIDIFKQTPAAYDTVGVGEFKRLLTDERNVLLDVRTSAEINDNAIPDAMHLDYFSKRFRSSIVALDRKTTYLVYCRNGGRARKSCKLMCEMGFTSVIMLKGGMKAWNKAVE